jgi:hypothetical protein
VLTGGGEERKRPESGRRQSATVAGGSLTRRWRSGAPPATGSGSSAPTRRGGRDGGIGWLWLRSNAPNLGGVRRRTRHGSASRAAARLASGGAQGTGRRWRARACRARGLGLPLLWGRGARDPSAHAQAVDRRRPWPASADGPWRAWRQGRRGRGRAGAGRAFGLGSFH